jgi:hypothetical protein
VTGTVGVSPAIVTGSSANLLMVQAAPAGVAAQLAAMMLAVAAKHRKFNDFLPLIARMIYDFTSRPSPAGAQAGFQVGGGAVKLSAIDPGAEAMVLQRKGLA